MEEGNEELLRREVVPRLSESDCALASCASGGGVVSPVQKSVQF